MVIEWAAEYPEEARVLGCSEFSLKNLYGQVYELKGYIIAPNGFGVEDRIYFSVRMTHIKAMRPTTWKIGLLKIRLSTKKV